MNRQGVVYRDHGSWHSYTIDGHCAVGVTTALKGIPKDEALKRWAAKLVAEYTVDNLYKVKEMLDSGGRGPTMYYLAELPNQRRDSAAVRGTEVHGFAERYVKGEEVDVPEALYPYVEGYAAFIEDYNPTSLHEELVVANRTHMYAGRLDSIQDIPGLGRCLVDYKTSNGVYGEIALQVAGYRYAEVYLDSEGNEQPMIEVDKTYILHIQPGGYDLYPVKADKAVFENFLTAKNNYLSNVQSRKLNKLIGEPLEPPRRDAS